jgi:hypothetical protein
MREHLQPARAEERMGQRRASLIRLKPDTTYVLS